MNAHEITKALKGKWHGRYGMVCCPAHKDRTPSCKVSDGDERPMFHCFAGCDWKAVVNAVEDMGLLPKWEPNRRSRPANIQYSSKPEFTRNDPDVKKMRGFAWDIWKQTKQIEGTLGERYFQERGIVISLPSCIRFHLALKEPSTGKLIPAVVISYTSYQGDFDGIQRIYLDADNGGKAKVENPKLSLGTFPGGMMRFAELQEPEDDWPYYSALGICEGPEDGLSILQEEGIAVWSAGAGEKMALAHLPQPLEALFIYGDNGEAGKVLAGKAFDAHLDKVRKQDGIPLIYKKFPSDRFDDFNEQLQARENAS